MGHLTVNKYQDYINVLNKQREEFLIRFNTVAPSSSKGLSSFLLVCALGSGTFGKVKMVRHRKTGKPYAVKIMNKYNIIAAQQVHHVLSERRILSAIRFPFTVWLEHSFKDSEFLYLFLPFVSGGELFDHHRTVGKFCEKEASFYAAQVFLALEYLHHCSVLYRDLKLENIMVDASGYIKLADFGFAKRVEERTATLCGTPEYLSPEAIQSQPYGKSVDWWSFGVLVFEFVAGHTPFLTKKEDVLGMFQRIIHGKYHTPSHFSLHLKSFCKGLLQVDVTKRLGIVNNGVRDIKDHEWFQSTDWETILHQKVVPYFIPEPFRVKPELQANESLVSRHDKVESVSYDEIFAEF